jgi:hypothetical protein
MTYEDYKLTTCDICGVSGSDKELGGLVLCLSCFEKLFETGGGKITQKPCPCCGDYYTDYDGKDFDFAQTQIPTILEQGYQDSIGEVTALPEGYFDIYPFLLPDKIKSLQEDIPALAGMSYAIQYHEDGEGETLLLESKLSKSKTGCEFYLFYKHDYKGSCEGIQQQLLSGEY